MARADDISHSFDQADQKLVERAVATAETLAARASEIGLSFDGIDDKIGLRIAETADALNARATEISRLFDAVDERLVLRFAKGADTINARMSELGEVIDSADRKLAARIEDGAQTLGSRANEIIEIFENADQRLTARVGETAGTLAGRANEIGRVFQETDERIAASIEKSSDVLAGRADQFDRVFEAADQRIAARMDQTADSLAARAAEIGRVFEAANERIIVGAKAASDALAERAVEMGDVFKGADERLANRIGESTSTISQSCRGSRQCICCGGRARDRACIAVGKGHGSASPRHCRGAFFRRRTRSVRRQGRCGTYGRPPRRRESRLAKSVEDATALVDTSMVDMEGRMANSAEALGRKVGEHVASAEEQLISRADVISNTFSAVGKHIGDSTNDAARVLATNTRELNALMTERTAEINKLLDETARPLAGKLSDAHVELERTVEVAAERAAEKLRSENQVLADALASRTAETLAAVDGARNSLSTGVNELIGRMSASSAKLGKLIDAASENLTKVDTDLTTTTDRFAAATEKASLTFSSSARLVNSNTNRLTELSSGTLREVASIANTLRGAQPLADRRVATVELGAEQSGAHAGAPVGPRRPRGRPGQEVGRPREHPEILREFGWQYAGESRRPDLGIHR